MKLQHSRWRLQTKAIIKLFATFVLLIRNECLATKIRNAVLKSHGQINYDNRTNSVLESADTALAEVRTHAPEPPGKLDITSDMLLNHAFW